MRQLADSQQRMAASRPPALAHVLPSGDVAGQCDRQPESVRKGGSMGGEVHAVDNIPFAGRRTPVLVWINDFDFPNPLRASQLLGQDDRVSFGSGNAAGPVRVKQDPH